MNYSTGSPATQRDSLVTQTSERLGSPIHVSPHTNKLVLGAVLPVGRIILLLRACWQADDVAVRKIYWPLALLVGAVLGFLAGLGASAAGFS